MHHMLITCSSHAHHMLITCSSHAHHMLITCSSHAHHMLITCSSHAHHMLITCSSHAHHMLITCSSHFTRGGALLFSYGHNRQSYMSVPSARLRLRHPSASRIYQRHEHSLPSTERRYLGYAPNTMHLSVTALDSSSTDARYLTLRPSPETYTTCLQSLTIVDHPCTLLFASTRATEMQLHYR